MESKKPKIETGNRKSIFAELSQFCYLSKEDSFIEITKWINSEGFDVELYADKKQSFSLTYGEFKALKKLIKMIDNQ